MAVSAADITALMKGYTDLKSYYEGAAGTIDARVVAALKTVPQTLKVYFVHQATGNDGAEGTKAAPLRSVDEAVRRTPTGGIVLIYLLADYRFNSVVYCNGISVFLRADDSVARPKVTFDWLFAAGKIYRLGGFHPSYFGTWLFEGLTVELPTDPSPSDQFEYEHMLGFMAGSAQATPAVLDVKFSLCTFLIPAGSTKASIFGSGSSLMVVQFMSCVLPTAMKGRVVSGVGGDGVNPDTVTRKIVTNQPWI